MVEVHLTQRQLEALRGVLEEEIADERVEARRTDVSSFKRDMQARVAAVDEVAGHVAVDFTLDDGQAALLYEIVAHALGELRVETRRSSTWRYKDLLRERADDLAAVLAALSPAPESGVA